MTVGGRAPGRHDRVWLAAGWEDRLVSAPACAARPAIAAWLRSGLPAVAGRRELADGGAVALGIALPPGGPVRRAAFSVEADAIARVAPPLALGEALASAPAQWRPALARLDDDAQRAGLSLAVYGSLAWQHESGLPYVTASSDADLLARPRCARELRRVLALLDRHIASGAAPRIDGEILLPGGGGVAWRELAVGAARVLVKAHGAVAVVPVQVALGPLAEGTP